MSGLPWLKGTPMRTAEHNKAKALKKAILAIVQRQANKRS